MQNNVVNLVRRKIGHILLDIPPEVPLGTILHALFRSGYYCKSENDNGCYELAKLEVKPKMKGRL